MPNPKVPSQPQPRQLTARLRAGAARRYPATEAQLDVVRQLVRQRWEQQQQRRAQSPKRTKRASPTKRLHKATPVKTRQKVGRTPTQPKAQTQTMPQTRGYTH